LVRFSIQTLGRERLIVFLRGVEHHFDNPLDPTVGRRQTANVQSEAAGDRGTNLPSIEDFTLDRAGIGHILRKGLEHGLATQRKTQRLDTPHEPPLPVAHGYKSLRQGFLIPPEVRPVSPIH
jgi:hypothetical protein